MWRRVTVWISVFFLLISTLTIVFGYYPPRKRQKTVLDHIQYWNRLRKFYMLVQTYNLTHHLQQDDVTVFVPVSSVYDRFLNEATFKYGYNTSDPDTMKNIVLYHIGDGITSVSRMESITQTRTLHPGHRMVYFNNYNYGDTKIYTVNGAWIVTADIVASNGIVHVIDRFLIPVQSNKTIAEYLESPSLPQFAFQSIKKASIIDPALKMATNSSSGRFTVFAPDDSYITVMPSYGQDILFNDTDLLKTVFWAHVIEEKMLFLPKLGDIPHTAAMAGVLKFYREGSELYVSSNKVRAKIIQANIPVSNGVIHVLDDLLFFIYRNMKQKIDTLKNSNFVKASLNTVEEELQQKFTETVRKMTFFLPTDDAMSKLPASKQLQLDTNNTKLSKFFRDHLVMYDERDFESFQEGETFTTSDGEILTIRTFRDDIYVEGGGVRAKITVPDVGCTNGVIHLVNSALFQRDFTIWEAIQGNSQLKRMTEFIKLNQDLMETLSATSNGPMTVFLVSDAAVNNLPADTLQYLQTHSSLILEAIHGSIAHGVILSSTHITDEQDVTTLSGKIITLYNVNQGIYVIGSKVRVNVVIHDIWCSNGMLHITDGVLHLPTRNLMDEMELQPSLSVMSGIMEAFPSLRAELSDTSKYFTMFVPSDDAFTYIPSHRTKVLSESPPLLQHIVESHIVPDVGCYIEDYGNYTKLTSNTDLPLFILRTQDDVYAISNNVRGKVVESDIRCTNGIIHIVDTLLNFPFWTVEETMDKTSELRPYLSLIQQVLEFTAWSATFNINQTLFVPSGTFLTNLDEHHRIRIVSEPGLVEKLYQSHTIPSALLNQQYFDKAFQSSRVHVIENRYNYTFTFIDSDISDKSELVSVDLGYANLIQSVDIVRDGIACSNGIIYTINGFLSYPLYDTLVEIKRQPEISIGADQLLKLIPSNASLDLSSKDTVFTVFAPRDDAFNYLTLHDINYINQNLSYTERMEIIQRHIVRGQRIEYDRIIDGSFSVYARDRNISVISKTDGFYLEWEDIEAKIVRPNILTTNGIIHVVDRLLLSTPCQTSTTPPTTTQKQVSSSNTPCLSVVLVFICVVFSILENFVILWREDR